MQAVERIREVLELIVCPACQGQLTLAESTVNCEVCGRRYPVVDGIPILLVERADTRATRTLMGMQVEEGIDHPISNESGDENGHAQKRKHDPQARTG